MKATAQEKLEMKMNRSEVEEKLAYWLQRRDTHKAQWYDVHDVPCANMKPIDDAIAHADRHVQFWTEQLAIYSEISIRKLAKQVAQMWKAGHIR